MFPKDHMPRNTKTFSNEIITPITFLTNSIPKKTTQTRTRLKFVSFMILKKNKIDTSEDSKRVIGGRRTKQHIIRSLILNNGRRTPIDGVNDNKSSFPPKLCRSRSGYSSCTNNIKNMTKFALIPAILLRSASIRGMRNNTKLM